MKPGAFDLILSHVKFETHELLGSSPQLKGDVK